MEDPLPQLPQTPPVNSPDWPCRHELASASPPRLRAFLYRLLRDGAKAPGDVEQIALDARNASRGTVYTNPHLDAYAKSLVTFLLAEPDQPLRTPKRETP
jgi:hypothetical protein